MPPLSDDPGPRGLQRLLIDYRLRWWRRRLLARAIHARRDLTAVADRTAAIHTDAILCVMAVRNEAMRLPHFLDHHRGLGIDHFLVVDNASDDGTADLLIDQPDVSLWSTRASYKRARFGLDWVTWLLARHGHGHWCLTLDADEILIYPHWETRPLPALTAWLEATGARAMAAMMLDMYPRGPLGSQTYRPGDDPFRLLEWFDSGNYSLHRQPRLGNLWIQGGARARAFFADSPRRAPTLNKVPLVRWNRRYAYVNSTHAILPRRLNATWAPEGGEATSGLLLHTKFLPQIIERSREERERKQHFAHSARYEDYYDGVIAGPDLWCETSARYRGWRHLEALGLMSRGGWL